MEPHLWAEVAHARDSVILILVADLRIELGVGIVVYLRVRARRHRGVVKDEGARGGIVETFTVETRSPGLWISRGGSPELRRNGKVECVCVRLELSSVDRLWGELGVTVDRRRVGDF